MVKKSTTQLVEIDISDLIPADWNYKTDGTQEDIDKLCASITEDSSAGVIAVRELEGKFEVIDGNHRLTALQQLKWKKVPCENFGDITKAKAIIIARRRNHQWFRDDLLKYAALMRDEVLPEYPMDDLVLIMPDTREEMETLKKLLDYDPSQYGPPGEGDGDNDKDSPTFVEFSAIISEEAFEVWLEAQKKVLERLKDEGHALHSDKVIMNGQVMEMLAAEYMAGG